MKSETTVSFLVPARNASLFLERTIATIHKFLSSRFDERFEILIIPNGDDGIEYTRTVEVAQVLATQYSNIKVCPHTSSIHGKGAALKTGFKASTGDWIFFTDADLPYELDFFDGAIKQLNEGCDFVTGNRRTLQSYFTVPVSILPFVYLRHMLGLVFNIIVRQLFGIHSHDTQAGIKAMTRDLAGKAFELQTCPGFLFDIEFFLVAEQQGYRKMELPVHLYLSDEKTTIKFARETWTCLQWLPKIAYQKFCGHYKTPVEHLDLKNLNCLITADDWGLSPEVNQGILKLARLGVVNRVSILTGGRFSSTLLEELKQLDQVQLGLHFNLTHNNLCKSPGDLLIFTLNPFVSAKTKRVKVKKQLLKQLEELKELGVNPQHIDGHHHCHIFPFVVDEVAQISADQKIPETRLPSDPQLWLSSKFLLPLLSLFAKSVFDRHQLKYRPFFYPSLALFKHPTKLKQALRKRAGYEIIVHPAETSGAQNFDLGDSYSRQRVIEYDALNT
jgi:predicted glycoside hydrolase/deacetylase ChbG (UPF0249 family)